MLGASHGSEAADSSALEEGASSVSEESAGAGDVADNEADQVEVARIHRSIPGTFVTWRSDYCFITDNPAGEDIVARFYTKIL